MLVLSASILAVAFLIGCWHIGNVIQRYRVIKRGGEEVHEFVKPAKQEEAAVFGSETIDEEEEVQSRTTERGKLLNKIKF